MADKKVLLVDDDPDLVKLVGAWLRGEGYSVISTGDTMGCLQMARREEPDVIVLDLGLPAGGGLVALERLKMNAQFSHIPVVVLTGEESTKVAEQAQEKGAAGYVHKSGSKEGLLLAVHRAHDAQSTQDSF